MKIIICILTICISFKSNAQWVKVGGPSIGSVTCIAVDGIKIYAGTYGGGIFRSTDNGNSWSEANGGLNSLFVTSISISGSKIYAVAGSIFLSVDEGTSWNQINNGLPQLPLNVVTTYSNRVFVGLTYGVYVSDDSGNTWNNFSNGLTSLDAQALVVMDSQLLVGTRSGGIFISNADSSAWTSLNNGFPRYITSLEVRDKIIFAGVAGDGIYISSDTGTTWRHTNNLNGLSSGSIFSIASNDSIVIAGTLSGCFSTTDTGNSWQNISSGLKNTFVTSVAANDSIIFSGTQGSGVFKSSDNGFSWNSSNINFTGSFSEGFLQSGNDIFNFGEGGIYKTSNSGLSWNDMNGGIVLTFAPNIKVNSMSTDGIYLYAGLQIEGVLRSSDSGSTWTAINNGLDIFSDVYDIVCSGNYIYANTSTGFYFSSDNGNIWTSNRISMFETIAVIGNRIFGGGTSGIESSTDNGLTWTSLNNGLPTLFITNDLFTNGNNLFAATDVGIFMSPDSGNSWSNLNNAFSAYNFQRIYANGPYILASTSVFGEIIYSNDNGNSWTFFNSGLPNTLMTSFIIDGSTAYAGSFGSGIYVNNNLINNLNDHFKNQEIVEIAPNPTTGDFYIRMNSKDNNSKLEIINITGQTIYSCNLDPNSTSVEHLQIYAADGTYLVKITDDKKGLIGSSILNIISIK